MEHANTDEPREQLVTLPMFEAWLVRSAEEFDRRQAESRAEFERSMAESRAEFERSMAESRAEFERSKAEFDRRHAEFDREQAELRARLDRGLAESRAKFDQMMAEIAETSAKNHAKLSAEIDRVNKSIGELGNSIGELVEVLLSAHAEKKFERFGYHFVNDSERVRIRDDNKQVVGEIDLLLTDGDAAMGVEVKRRLNDRRYVDDHLARMELARKYPPKAVGDRRLLGAIAGGIVDPDVAAYAYSKGIFVLELTGESVTLIEPPLNFVPKQW
jgi:hypothetical protein